MKQILNRIFHHEELTTEEARVLLLDISNGRYADAQIAALLAAFQMRGITVDELIGFRQALMETRVPVDFAPYRPIERSTSPPAPALSWQERDTKWRNTAITEPRR